MSKDFYDRQIDNALVQAQVERLKESNECLDRIKAELREQTAQMEALVQKLKQATKVVEGK